MQYLSNISLSWEVYHPEGELMFYCDEKKAIWYLSRNLAEVLDERKIKLLFTPKGKGESIKTKIKKPSKCVCCGTDKELTKHHIVPRQYRKFLPNDLKEHYSYDVMFMCWEHHEKYERKADILKKSLEERVDIENLKRLFSMKTKVIKNLIKYLKGEHMHENVICKLDENIKKLDAYGEKTEHFLKKVENLDLDPNKKIVESYENPQDFIVMWRNHFISEAKPNYMPDGWNINTVKDYKNVQN